MFSLSSFAAYKRLSYFAFTFLRAGAPCLVSCVVLVFLFPIPDSRLPVFPEWGVNASLRGVGQIYHLISVLNSSIFHLSSRFWDYMVIIFYRRVICIYDYSGWANGMENNIHRTVTNILFAKIILLRVAFWEHTRMRILYGYTCVPLWESSLWEYSYLHTRLGLVDILAKLCSWQRPQSLPRVLSLPLNSLEEQ